MKASVGIITHNRASIIHKCLEGVKRQTIKPAKIIIVDTSDDTKTRDVVKKYNMPIKYVRIKKRVRQPAARNLILKMTETDIIAFLDDDAVPKKRWLENIIKGYAIGDRTAAVAGPAVNCDKNLRPMVKYKFTNKTQNTVNQFADVKFNGAWIPEAPTKCRVMIGANMSFLTD